MVSISDIVMEEKYFIVLIEKTAVRVVGPFDEEGTAWRGSAPESALGWAEAHDYGMEGVEVVKLTCIPNKHGLAAARLTPRGGWANAEDPNDVNTQNKKWND